MLEGEPMARKRTKKEAKQRIDDLPPLLPILPRQLRRKLLPVRAIEEGSKFLAKQLIETDPLGRLATENGPGVAQIPLVGTGNGGRFTNIELAQARRRQAMQDIINDPMIKMTPTDLEIINDDTVIMLDDGNIAQIVPDTPSSRQFERQNILPQETKQKRKRSKYNIELGKQLERLKKEKPRTVVTKLMREAHKRTRKALGMPPKRRKR